MPRRRTLRMAEKLQLDENFRPLWDELQSWLPFEPKDSRDRLADDLESEDDQTFYSAAFELYLSYFFASRSWEFVRHPSLEGTDRSPDYLVRHPDGDLFVEATLALESEEQRRALKLRQQLRDDLDDVTGPWACVMTLDGEIPGGYSSRKMVRFLREALADLTLGPGESRELNFDDPPLRASFDVLPNPGHDGPVVAAEMTTGSTAKPVTTGASLYDAVRNKASRYGDLNRPYVVAVQPLHDLPIESFSLASALYGTIDWHIKLLPGHAELSRETHQRSGVLTGRGQDGDPIRTRVSAVAVYRRTTRRGEGTTHDLVVCHNPFASRPLDQSRFEGVPQLIPVEIADSTVTMRWTEDPPPPEWAVRS